MKTITSPSKATFQINGKEYSGIDFADIVFDPVPVDEADAVKQAVEAVAGGSVEVVKRDGGFDVTFTVTAEPGLSDMLGGSSTKYYRKAVALARDRSHFEMETLNSLARALNLIAFKKIGCAPEDFQRHLDEA